MTIWEGTEKGHHRVYVLRQHRYGKPLWNVVEHPPPRSLKIPAWCYSVPNSHYSNVSQFFCCVPNSPYSFPHCLAERQCDQTLNQSNKVWHVLSSSCYSVPNSPYSNLSTHPSRSSSVLSGTQSRLEACLSTYLLLSLAIMLQQDALLPSRNGGMIVCATVSAVVNP